MTSDANSRPNPTSRAQLRALFIRRGFHPRKELGQSFLVDGNIAAKIVRAAALTGAEPVLEIGAGAGAVTHLLVKQTRRLVAIEIDPFLVSVLAETVGPEIEIIQGDFLKVDLTQLLGSGREGAWRCVANLPYSITGPAIMRLLDHSRWFERLVILVQHEVAERLLAQPGTRARGLLTVLAEAACSISSLGNVSRHCFYPQPKVDSTILLLTPRRPPLVPPETHEAFTSVVKAAFSTRRKTLANAISLSMADLPKQDVAALLSQSGVDPGRRAEALTAHEFLTIAERLLLASDRRL